MPAAVACSTSLSCVSCVHVWTSRVHVSDCMFGRHCRPRFSGRFRRCRSAARLAPELVIQFAERLAAAFVRRNGRDFSRANKKSDWIVVPSTMGGVAIVFMCPRFALSVRCEVRAARVAHCARSASWPCCCALTAFTASWRVSRSRASSRSRRSARPRGDPALGEFQLQHRLRVFFLQGLALMRGFLQQCRHTLVAQCFFVILASR